MRNRSIDKEYKEGSVQEGQFNRVFTARGVKDRGRLRSVPFCRGVLIFVLVLFMQFFPHMSSRTYAVEKLQIHGTTLQTVSGTAIQLKGVSTHGLAWYPEYINKSAFQSVKDWGCNAVRLALYPYEYNGYCTGGDQTALKELISKGVSYAKKLDLYVIIDWHVLNEQTPTRYKSTALKFFSEMAATYKNCPNVIFEICNEPNGSADWKTIKSYARDVINVIRSQGSDAIIIVGTPTWSQDVDVAASDPITGQKNIAYALHFYANTHRDSLRQKALAAINKGLPLFVSEFGICDASGSGSVNKTEANKWMQLLDNHKISYMMWALSNKNETCSLIKSSCSKTSGWKKSELSASGKWYVNHLGGKTASDEGKSTSKTSTVSGGRWVKIGKHYKYRMANGRYAKSCWIKKGKKYYYVDKHGYRKTGWLTLNGKRYYLSKNGVRLTGKHKIKGKWYVFRANGQLIQN